MKNLLLIFLLLTGTGYSQSFKPLTINSKVNLYCDENFDGIVRGMRVDAVIKDGKSETIIFHNEFLRKIKKWNCYDPFSASWLGEKCVIDTAIQIAYFFNENGDTLFVEYSKQVGDEWDFYKKGNKIIKAKVTGINLEKLPDGKEDVIKSIQLYKYNLSGNDEWAYYKPALKISEKYGFTQLLDFLEMPELKVANIDKGPTLQCYHLIPNRIITISDIYNFNEGDEFEYSVYDPGNMTDYHMIEVIKKYSKFKYLLKNTYQNNTAYSSTGKIVREIKFEIDTFIIEKNDTLLNASKVLPLETFFKKPSSYVDFIQVNYRDNLYCIPTEEFGFYNDGKDTCWYGPPDRQVTGHQRDLKEGYGYVISYSVGYDIYEKMIYSKKGTKTTGTLIPLGLNEIQRNDKVFLYPNPTSNKVFIGSGKSKIEGYRICSMNGQTLIDARDYNINEGINISHLADGLYFITIQSAGGNSTIRFLKTENK